MFFVLFIKHFYNSICVPFFLIFDTWHNLGHPSHPLSTHATCFRWVHIVCDFCRITCLSRAVLRYPTPDASKNVKFRLSWNSMKLNMMARFRETIPTVKSISSSEIEKNYGFLPKLPFYPFSKNWNFLGSYSISKLCQDGL